MPPTNCPDRDLEAYFQRIGFTGERIPTLAVLRDLTLRHAQTIPWEDLDVLLRKPIQLDLASLTQKLIYNHRGGYCFEQNTLFQTVLEAIGFEVIPLQARVLWAVPEGTRTGRTHMALKVIVEETAYLVDVGFGPSTPTGPIRIEPDTVQSTPHESFRLIPADPGFILQLLLHDTGMPLYHLSLDPGYPIDYEIANYYISTHPASRFYNLLLVACTAPECRHVLVGPEYKRHIPNGETERRQMQTVSEFRELLTDTFLIRLPDTPQLDLILERVIASPQSRL